MRILIYFNLLLITYSFVYPHSKDAVRAKNGMVVSASDLASLAGVEIIRKGGNAVDAAIATGFALAVTHPAAGNIGGGGFMVIRDSDGSATTIDFREIAPAKAAKNMYLDSKRNYNPKLSQTGMLSVGVPGSVAGLYYAWEKYGSLEWSELIQPAFQLALEGFPLSYRLAKSFNNYQKEFAKYKSSRKIFRDPEHPFTEGELFVQEDLAKTLKLIMDKGKDGFYSGKTAELLIKSVQNQGGIITLDDLKNYKPLERKPIIGFYRGYKVISMPPSSSGGIALLEILNSMEYFSFSKDQWGSSKYIHTLAEIFKHVYADRSEHLGDPGYYNVPVEFLTSKDYGKVIANSVSERAVPSHKIAPVSIESFRESEETTHYSIIDNYGSAVSVTTTLNSSFGNKIVVEGAGFLLNNEMDDFSPKPGEPNQFGLLGSEANSIEPGKRMLSSMTPTIILKNEKPFLILGAPGGSTIITSVAQVILNVIDFDMDIQTAVDLPRIHHQWFPERIDYEKFGLSADVKRNLEKMGHFIGKERIIGRVQAILIDDEGVRWGASDPRSFGKAEGY